MFPSLLGMPRTARDLGFLGSPEVPNEDPGFVHLSRYLDTRHLGDLRGTNLSINLEEVLTLLEIDIAIAPEPKLLFARAYLIRLLRRTLMRLHKRFKGASKDYPRMVKRLAPNDTIITFNWDVLLDNALGRQERLNGLGATDDGNPHFAKPPTRYDDFLLHFTGWGERTIHGISVPSPVNELTERGYYLKAHGSIDWYYCSNVQCRAVETVFPMLGSSKRPICSACRERTEVLIVPPTLNKRLRDVPLTRRVWTLASSEVAQSTHLAIWGYSLPPTDFFSSWLLRNSRHSMKELTLINPEVSRGSEDKPKLNKAFVGKFVNAVSRSKRSFRLRVFRSYDEFENNLSPFDTVAGRRELERL